MTAISLARDTRHHAHIKEDTVEQQFGGMLLLTVLLTFVGVAMVVDAAVSTARRWCARQIVASWRRFGSRAHRAVVAGPSDRRDVRARRTPDHSPSRDRAWPAFAHDESMPARHR